MARREEFSDTVLERNTLAVLLQSEEAALKYFSRLLPKHFTDDNLRRLFTLVRRFVTRSGSAPTREALRVELSMLYSKDSELVLGVLGLYDQLVEASRVASTPFLVSSLVNYARVRDALSSIERFAQFLDDGRIEDALRIYEEDALALQASDPEVFITRGEVVQDYEKRKALIADMEAHPEKYRGVLTGIDDLDRVTGGLWKGELGFCFGKSGVGKSFFLLQVAYYAFMQNLCVLVIPIEMPLIQWQRRFDSRISHVAYEKFKWATLTSDEKVQWERSVLRARAQFSGKGARVHITHIPTGCTVPLVRVELERLIRLGEPADMLIIDYAGLMRTPRQRYTEHGELSAIFEELKGMATAYDIPVWTASQAKRGSFRRTELGQEDVGYSQGIVNISDLVVGIARSDVEILTERLILSISKYRDGVLNKTIILSPNLAIAMIDRAV